MHLSVTHQPESSFQCKVVPQKNVSGDSGFKACSMIAWLGYVDIFNYISPWLQKIGMATNKLKGILDSYSSGKLEYIIIQIGTPSLKLTSPQLK